MTIRTAAALAAPVVLSASATAGISMISSTFDADTEGWSTIQDASNFMWRSDVGSTTNPGDPIGAISATDTVGGQLWKFVASSDYLGDRSSSLGLQLSWEILGLTGDQADLDDRADLILTGGGLQIGIDTQVRPSLTQWTTNTVTLDATADWKIVNSFSGATLTGTDATQAQIQQVLADLDGLFILGEYTSGGDSSAIDNVALQIPAPAAAALAGVAGLAAVRRRR